MSLKDNDTNDDQKKKKREKKGETKIKQCFVHTSYPASCLDPWCFVCGAGETANRLHVACFSL